MNNPTRCALCDTMIGRADIEGSKSNVAMNARLPQVSSWLPISVRHLLRSSSISAFADSLSRGSGLYLKRSLSTHCHLVSELHPWDSPKDLAADCPRISSVVTVPEVVTLATPAFQPTLGSLSLRVFPHFDSVARRLASSFESLGLNTLIPVVTFLTPLA